MLSNNTGTGIAPLACPLPTACLKRLIQAPRHQTDPRALHPPQRTRTHRQNLPRSPPAKPKPLAPARRVTPSVLPLGRMQNPIRCVITNNTTTGLRCSQRPNTFLIVHYLLNTGSHLQPAQPRWPKSPSTKQLVPSVPKIQARMSSQVCKYVLLAPVLIMCT